MNEVDLEDESEVEGFGVIIKESGVEELALSVLRQGQVLEGLLCILELVLLKELVQHHGGTQQARGDLKPRREEAGPQAVDDSGSAELPVWLMHDNMRDHPLHAHVVSPVGDVIRIVKEGAEEGRNGLLPLRQLGQEGLKLKELTSEELRAKDDAGALVVGEVWDVAGV